MKSRKYHHGRGINGGSFSISTDKFSSTRLDSSLLRNNYVRVGLCACVLLVIFLIIPDVREGVAGPAALGTVATLFANVGSRGSTRIPTVKHYDLGNSIGTDHGWERGERILFCAPLRDAAQHLPMFFSHLRNLTYPHHLIDLAFLVSDSKDNTMGELVTRLDEIQASADVDMRFGEISILEKDFGQAIGQSFSDRHGFAAQGPRRKLMARARNWLLTATLKPEHAWVYWRDVDVETAPPSILEDLMRHDKDIIVPNVWRPLPDWLGGEQPYDLNSWAESETALKLADSLAEDAVIVEGYAEYATWRPHLAYLRDPYGDPDEEMPLDGIGGVSILARASVFRSGCHFPAFSFEKHAETEGFGKLARRMGYSVVGLPHYVIWHLYEPSIDDLKHMEEMEKERLAKEAEELKQKHEAAGHKAAKDRWEQDQKALFGDASHAGLEGGEAGPLAHAGEAKAQRPASGQNPNDNSPSENGQTLPDGSPAKQRGP
ncbi:Mannan polymerase II complex anp1 subunit [Savitreella phatthalungensis]